LNDSLLLPSLLARRRRGSGACGPLGSRGQPLPLPVPVPRDLALHRVTGSHQWVAVPDSSLLLQPAVLPAAVTEDLRAAYVAVEEVEVVVEVVVLASDLLYIYI